MRIEDGSKQGRRGRVFAKWLDEHHLEILKGTLGSVGVRVGGAVAGFAFMVVLARLLGATHLGAFVIAQSIVVVAASISRAGYEFVLVRTVATARITGSIRLLRDSVWQACRHVLVLSLAAAAALFGLAPEIARSISGDTDLAPLLRVASAALPPLSLLTLLAFALQGLKKNGQSSALIGLYAPLIGVLLLLVAWPQRDPQVAMWIYLVSCVATFLIAWWLWARAASTVVGGTHDELVPLAPHRTSFFLVSMSQLIPLWAPPIVLGVLGTQEAAGLFSIAQKTAMLTIFLTISINTIASPKFAELWQQGELERLDVLGRTLSLTGAAAMFPLMLVFVFWPGLVVSVFGDGYQGAAKPLAIIATGLFVSACVGPYGHMLLMTGSERAMAKQYVSVSVVLIGLLFVLVPPMGATGAAIAVAVGFAMQSLFAWWLMRRTLRNAIRARIATC